MSETTEFNQYKEIKIKIVESWGLNNTLLSNLITTHNPALKLSESKFRNTLDKCTNPNHKSYKVVCSAIQSIFPHFDFDTKKVLDGKSIEHELDKQFALRGEIRNRAIESEDSQIFKFETKYSPSDLQILKNLEGLYFGYFFDDQYNNNQIRNFVFWIKPKGEVELKGGKNYYKFGKIILGPNTVAFLLNGKNGTLPELYYTKFLNNFQDDDYEVSEMILTGVWTSNSGEPSFGSSLLFKNGETHEFESYSLLESHLEKGSIRRVTIGDLKITDDKNHKERIKILENKLNKEIFMTISQKDKNLIKFNY